MFKAFMICAMALLVSAQAGAQTTPQPQPASSESIKELFDLLNMRSMLGQLADQADAMVRSSIDDTLRGRTLSPEQQGMVDELTKRTSQLVRDSISWDSLEPMIADVYQKSLSEEELQGMIAFYRTPAGVALIAKMPLITRNTMIAVQERQKTLMANLQQILQDTLADLKARSAVSGS